VSHRQTYSCLFWQARNSDSSIKTKIVDTHESILLDLIIAVSSMCSAWVACFLSGAHIA